MPYNEQDRLRAVLSHQSYTGQAGELRWKTNQAVIGPEVFRDAGMTPPRNQQQAYDQYVAEVLAQYRSKPPQYDSEQLSEMRAAFGVGVEVVDVVTGKKFKT